MGHPEFCGWQNDDEQQRQRQMTIKKSRGRPRKRTATGKRGDYEEVGIRRSAEGEGGRTKAETGRKQAVQERNLIR
jgi:hypothetical protein